MSYVVAVRRAAQQQMDKLGDRDREQLVEKILALGDEPRPRKVVRLSGVDLWRLRVRRFRIVYHIDDGARVVTVVRVAKRSEQTYRWL